MTSDRPYRRGMKHEQAIGIIKENAGAQFDPAIVVVFLELDLPGQETAMSVPQRDIHELLDAAEAEPGRGRQLLQ